MLENFAKDFDLKGRGDSFIHNKTPWQNGNGSIVGQQHGLKDASKEDISKPRNMLPTSFPDVTALFFTALCIRGEPIKNAILMKSKRKIWCKIHNKRWSYHSL